MKLNKRSVCFLTMLLAFVVQIPFSLRAQSDVVGKYYMSNNSVELNADSTFTFSWRVCLMNRWSSGTWRVENDTIYFKVVPVYDTVTYSDKKIKVKHVYLSENGQSVNAHLPIASFQFTEPFRFSIQEENHFPKALFFRKNKLFAISENRRIVRKKERRSFFSKGFRSWYVKDLKS